MEFATRKRQRENDARAGDEGVKRSTTMKPLSIFNWYRILRVRHQFPLFQAIRGALWLAR